MKTGLKKRKIISFVLCVKIHIYSNEKHKTTEFTGQDYEFTGKGLKILVLGLRSSVKFMP